MFPCAVVFRKTNPKPWSNMLKKGIFVEILNGTRADTSDVCLARKWSPRLLETDKIRLKRLPFWHTFPSVRLKMSSWLLRWGWYLKSRRYMFMRRKNPQQSTRLSHVLQTQGSVTQYIQHQMFLFLTKRISPNFDRWAVAKRLVFTLSQSLR